MARIIRGAPDERGGSCALRRRPSPRGEGRRLNRASQLGAGHNHLGFEPGLRGWFGGQHRSAGPRRKFPRRCGESPMGDQRLSVAVERLVAAWRRGRGQVRSRPAFGCGYGLVRFCLDRLRVRAEPLVAIGRTLSARDRRGDFDAEQPGYAWRVLLRRSAGPGHWNLGLNGRGDGGGGPGPRRLVDRCGRLAFDLSHQPAAGDPPRSGWRLCS